MADNSEAKDEVVKSRLEEMEQLLEENDKRIQHMVSSIPNAFAYFLDHDGKFLFANSTVTKALQTSLEDIKGKGHSELIDVDEAAADSLAQKIKRVIETDQDIIIPDGVFRGHNGYKRAVRTHLSSMGYMGKKAVLVISAIIDEPTASEVSSPSHEAGSAVAEKHERAEEAGEASEEPAAKKARASESPDDQE